jgi:hypothetical protein
VKSSKAQIHAKFHKIPTIRFEDQKLTSLTLAHFRHFRHFSSLIIEHSKKFSARKETKSRTKELKYLGTGSHIRLLIPTKCFS